MSSPRRRTRPRRIALLKPDFGVHGGFERVVDRVEATLRRDGHDVTRMGVEVDSLRYRRTGPSVPEELWAGAPEYARYLASVAAFRRIDTRLYDAVVSTQPPSFAASHPRHLALFFHHHRVFYDLEEPYLAAGFAADPGLHRRAAEQVRRLDQPLLDSVTWFLAGSERVRARLAAFNGIDRVSLFQAGVGVGDRPLPPSPVPPAARRGAVLCVSRHEFPKRTELFVLAMKHLPGVAAVVVGSGGRLPWVRALDHRLSQPGVDLADVDPVGVWRTTAAGPPPAPGRGATNVELLGRTDDATLERLYAEAPCLVAPAYDEDYGLTALEAMRHGTPVVVCDDGGGLATLVDHEIDGLVVAPDGAAIAAAVDRILTDTDLAASLAAAGRAKAARITWARADEQLRDGLAEVLAA
ncbi:MAG: glycosyltransferase family 4 protein [Actinobacteria bacterium]|nr:glycosyltransferase family 4 protein [Actinomycetota bacterium]